MFYLKTIKTFNKYPRMKKFKWDWILIDIRYRLGNILSLFVILTIGLPAIISELLYYVLEFFYKKYFIFIDDLLVQPIKRKISNSKNRDRMFRRYRNAVLREKKLLEGDK